MHAIELHMLEINFFLMKFATLFKKKCEIISVPRANFFEWGLETSGEQELKAVSIWGPFDWNNEKVCIFQLVTCIFLKDFTTWYNNIAFTTKWIRW